MTIQANILPVAYRRRYRQHRRFRLWLASAATVGVLHLLFGAALGYGAEDTHEALSETAKLREQQQSRSQAFALLSVEEKQLIRRLELSQSFRRKHRWSELFASLVDRLPENVVLTKLETDPPKADPPRVRVATAKGNAKESTPHDQPDHTAKGLTISGVARDHESVATFLRAMTADSQIGHCQLESTIRQAFQEGEGVAFTIYIGW